MLTSKAKNVKINLLHNYIFFIVCGKNTLVKVRFPFFRFANEKK